MKGGNCVSIIIFYATSLPLKDKVYDGDISNVHIVGAGKLITKD